MSRSDDDDTQGPEPKVLHWRWRDIGFWAVVVFLAALVAGCGTTRYYPPAPHYDTMIVIEGSN